LLATANAHELRLLQKRLEYLNTTMSPEAEVDETALRKFDPDTTELRSLVYTLQRLLGHVCENELEAPLIEREILKERVARLARMKNIPKPFYEYYEPEFESLAATIRTLKSIMTPPR
jgi:hypothetical protein